MYDLGIISLAGDWLDFCFVGGKCKEFFFGTKKQERILQKSVRNSIHIWELLLFLHHKNKRRIKP